MGTQNIAVVGLGRVGSDFLSELLLRKDKGVNIVCAAELNETEGKAKARDAGVTIRSLDEIINMGSAIDIIFDLTGSATVRRGMRDALAEKKNDHTVIAPENVAHIIWSLLTDRPLPDVHMNNGY